ncbi:hypothetical protein LSM04_004803 [Trypanosoma melophagium]|uniref:uncharacterized protein n=1 Tax=Trypanosoma melophagium TaxID=715481 RepID=UPI003519E049|nr:hypothetical protein LSM04_001887 [Trypanosoma melophagium]KAH9598576.1 hypothetical protein LSM04_004803 [Trypanosoma melophagium]
MFKLGDDGSAITYHVPVSPFVPLQHNKVDVSTVNRLANFSMRFAMEHGWCFDHEKSDKFQPTLEAFDEGYAHSVDDVTVFFAGVEAELCNEVPEFNADITPASMFFWGQFWVSYVGTTSYGIYGKLYYYEAEKEECREPLGVFRVTGVTVSKATRKPAQIPEVRAKLLREAMEKHNAVTPFPRAERLNVKDITNIPGLVADASCSHIAENFPTHPSVAPLSIVYTRKFKLRETDIDFNRHVNQIAMIQLIINTFRSASADTTTIFPRLLDTGVEPIISDLLIRRLRIDYIQEIPMSHVGASVTLFFRDEASRDTVISSSMGNRKGKLAELCYVAHGLPNNNGTPFIAVVGKLFVWC